MDASMVFDFENWVKERTKLVNDALDWACPADGSRLREAMRYSLLAGGKRIRPLLCLAAAEAVGGDPSDALPAASAVEMIHTFSLIHDDLPAMDDDDLRRGLPTSHKKFDEATAILAGDALQPMAFETLADSAEGVRLLAVTCRKVCAGQSLDLESEGRLLSPAALRSIHEQKTGALLLCSVALGGLFGGASEGDRKMLNRHGSSIGVAFQIVDDILDVTESSETLGKPANSDLKHDKATYPKLVGLDESRRLAREALDAALDAIEPLGEPAEPLRQIARWIVERNV